MRKRVLTLLCIGLFALSLGACGAQSDAEKQKSQARVAWAQTKVDALTELSLDKLFAYDEAKTAYAGLTKEEKKQVNVELLTAAEQYFASADRLDGYNAILQNFPAPQSMSKSDWETFNAIRKEYEGVTGELATLLRELEIYQTIVTYADSTRYEDDKILYLGTRTELDVAVAFNANELESVSLNGVETDGITKTDSGLTLSTKVISAMQYGANKVEFTVTQGDTFAFLVMKGVSEGEILYYDFDVSDYSNTAYPNVVVPSTKIENGADGNALHFKSQSAGGTWFSARETADFGFPAFDFVDGTEYLVSFDLQILSGTDANWWSPIKFATGGDVLYLGNNAIVGENHYKTPDTNTLYSQATIKKGENGVWTVTAVFRANAQTKTLEFPSWDGGMDAIVDNILIEKLNPDITRIACVGDGITEGTNNGISYPEALQMQLGYDEYFVYNFGKSGSTVLTTGSAPYKTHAKAQYDYLKTWQPDVIVTMLGTNDSKLNKGVKMYGDSAYIESYNGLIDEFETLADKVYLATSPYVFADADGIEADTHNGHLVNLQAYVAYKQGIPVIDIHGATKSLDYKQYFPDYVRGNDAGHAEIAKAMRAGLTQQPSTYKYHLKYALDFNVSNSDGNYQEALAVYNNPNATQEEIDNAFRLIEGEMGTLTQPTWNGSVNMYYKGGDLVLPLTLEGNTIVSITIGEHVLSESDYTVSTETVVIPASVLSGWENKHYTCAVQVAMAKKAVVYPFILYKGYSEGEYFLLDGDLLTYTSKAGTADIISPCTVEPNGINGKSLHFSPLNNASGNGTLLEIRSSTNPGFDFPTFDFEPGLTYKMSFRYKALAGTAEDWRIRLNWNGETVTYFTDYNMPQANTNKYRVGWYKDANGVISFSVIFTVPETGIQSVSFENGSIVDILVDDFVICPAPNEDLTVYKLNGEDASYVTTPDTDNVVSPCTIVPNGINGNSLYFSPIQNTTGSGVLFMLYNTGKSAFNAQEFPFEAGKCYEMSFTYKALEGTATNWSTRIYWSSNVAFGNIAYLTANDCSSADKTLYPVTWRQDGSIITVSIKFRVPDAGIDVISFENGGVSHILMDDFLLCQTEEFTTDVVTTEYRLDGDEYIYTRNTSTDIIAPCEIVDNAINGKSLHFKPVESTTGRGLMFAVYQSGQSQFAFPEFAFQAGQEYQLSFKYKVLAGTASDWGLNIGTNTTLLALVSATNGASYNSELYPTQWNKDENDIVTFSVKFTIPESGFECLKFDNTSAGELWVDDLLIAPVVPEDTYRLDGDTYVYTRTTMIDIIAPCEIIDNGINGKSLHFKPVESTAGNGVMFLLYQTGKSQFASPEFDFTAGRQYRLSFQYKVLTGTADNWELNIGTNTTLMALISATNGASYNSELYPIEWSKDENGIITFSMTFTIPESGFEYLKFDSNASSDLWVDDLVIEPVTQV